MPFKQNPPELGNQYEEDRVLRSYLARTLPPEMLREIEPELVELGRLAGGELYRLQLEDRLNEPRLVQWDAWGERVDRVEVTRVWQTAERHAAERGLVAVPYERRHGRFSRVHQFALAYLFTPSTDIYSCPLAMTDGAARTLIASQNRELIDRVVPRLTSRDPETFWTSGQWMTELAGGSDVGNTETVARMDEDGVWRLYGRKWFTSAAASQVALTLARPEGNDVGGRGLALFFIETRGADGRLRNIRIERLKDKLGTRKVPTAELTLDGTPAELVCGTSEGVRNIAPMLNVTRLWNGVSAAALMRRGVALATNYARKRTAFGAPLIEKPLHVDTLAGLQAEAEAAFHFAFYVAELVGLEESGEITDEQTKLLRLLTPLMKLTTARQAVAVASEVLEAFGGAGYVEDTGLPVLLRDSQVLSIWEGTTNVLALDVLNQFKKDDDLFRIYADEVNQLRSNLDEDKFGRAMRATFFAAEDAKDWFHKCAREVGNELEAGARRFALTLGRTFSLALLLRHAGWSSDIPAASAALRFHAAGVNLLSRQAEYKDAFALTGGWKNRDRPLDERWPVEVAGEMADD